LATRSVALDGGATVRLLAALARRGVTVEAALVTALATVITVPEADDRLLLFLERHGRDFASGDVDVSRTVGWFTAVFPLCVRVAAGRRPLDTLAAVDRCLRAVPRGGVGWALLAIAPDAESHRPEISCNYLGRVEPPRGLAWRIAPESVGAEVGTGGTRPTTLDVVAHIAGERLYVAWHYDAVAHTRDTIEGLAERALGVLEALAGESS
jgi:non-ribosomal peptide synthase protein (TIGR01720 family)